MVKHTSTFMWQLYFWQRDGLYATTCWLVKQPYVHQEPVCIQRDRSVYVDTVDVPDNWCWSGHRKEMENSCCSYYASYKGSWGCLGHMDCASFSLKLSHAEAETYWRLGILAEMIESTSTVSWTLSSCSKVRTKCACDTPRFQNSMTWIIARDLLRISFSQRFSTIFCRYCLKLLWPNAGNRTSFDWAEGYWWFLARQNCR